MTIYKLYSTLYLDRYDELYKRIIAIDKMPQGLLSNYIRKIQRNKLSPFDVQQNSSYNFNCNNHCIYAILDVDNKHNFLCLENISDLLNFLMSNGYTIDTSVTKLLIKNKRINNNDDIICFISD